MFLIFSIDILNVIWNMKRVGIIISDISQDIMIEELHFLITKGHEHGMLH